MQYVESATLELKEQVNADFKKEVVAFATVSYTHLTLPTILLV